MVLYEIYREIYLYVKTFDPLLVFINLLNCTVQIKITVIKNKMHKWTLEGKKGRYYLLVSLLDLLVNKGNNKITELRTILQRESQNS